MALTLVACSGQPASVEPTPDIEATIQASVQATVEAGVGEALFSGSFSEGLIDATPRPLSAYSLGEDITVDASHLRPFWGDPAFSGEVTINFLSTREIGRVNDERFGSFQPKGIFRVLYYSVENGANLKIQPGTQIGDVFSIVDDKGRQWDAHPDAYVFARRDYREDPNSYVGPGFATTTAVAFDVPKSASGLKLRSDQLGIEVTLKGAE